MASEEDDTQALFQEEEVLWAKIRGYPWWPAFVDKVHPIIKGQEAQYTVFFFGDNTKYFSSKLGASKLRKFYQHYIEFYLKARPHRKLMASIQMAEEKLAQNDQNIQIFEALRNFIKAKPKGGKSLNRSDSRKSEHDLSEQRIQLPNLMKSKTQGCPNNSTNSICEDLSIKKEKTKDTKIEISNSSDNAVLNIQQKESEFDNKSKKQSSPGLQQQNRPKKQQEFHKIIQQPPKVQVKLVELVKELPVQKMIAESQPKIKVESEGSQSIEEQPSEDQIANQNRRKIIPKRKSNDQRFNKVPRKRGRPKKIFNNVEQLPSVKIHTQRRIQRLKRKIIRKVDRDVSSEMGIQFASLTRSNSELIQTIRNLCNNRDDLIDYLSSIQITVDNVKEILDLDVSNILQDGIITQRIIELLQMMKAALLYKYFPDDLKHKKKYIQLSKKIFVVFNGEKNEYSKEKEEDVCQNKIEEQQIRKKTIVKLQKFLKGHPQIQNQAKQIAVKIESYFEQEDNQIGERYKTIAFKVLKSLKEKSDTFNQVINKLDQHAYD